ncbi:hypothetical protein NP493_546g04018 [Ridgeia piscesae]|uniref:Uncharacterized protein n=1 Tax=Ridgeia piscesae TaxID=27915 RepID=A0AAD9KX41_RIDPI|nr:hypothetical protein NP493_546g04018 [Ridgeia piscesae]
MGFDSRKRSCLWELFVSFCRFWGVVTAIVLWGVGVETAYRRYALGAYLLLAALLMSVLESVFVVHFWTKVCLRFDVDGGEIVGSNVVANGSPFSGDSLANQDEIYEV